MSITHAYTSTKPEPVDATIIGAGKWNAAHLEGVRASGAVGDGVTDDTAAIQAALDAAKLSGEPVYLPAGDYLVAGLTLDDLTAGINIVGAGRGFTRLLTTSSTPIISLGTYDSTPANPWEGTGSGLHLSHVTLENEAQHNTSNVGVDQTSIGIQDNGSGGLTLNDVFFRGLKYGVYAPYGHDYCRYYDVDFLCCTTSMYFGPGSQQVYVYGGSSTLHDRAIVLEGAQQGAFYGFVFNEPKTRDIDILSPVTLESGVTGLGASLIAKEIRWSFNDCWFETGAGWTTGWGPVEHVRVGRTTDANNVRFPIFSNVKLVSGTTGMAAHDGGKTYAFLNVELGGFILIDGISVDGDYIEAMVTTPAASYFPITIRNHKTVDGWTGIDAFAGKQPGNVEVSDFYHGFNHTAYTATTVTDLPTLLDALDALGIIVDGS